MDAGKARGPVLEGAHHRLFSRASRGWHRASPGSWHHTVNGQAQCGALLLLHAALPQLPSTLLKPLLESPTQMSLISLAVSTSFPLSRLWSLHALFSPSPLLFGANISHQDCLAQRRGGSGETVAR